MATHIAAAAAAIPAPHQSSLVLYIITGLSALAAIAVWVPKILGPIGKGISEWSAGMRRAAQDAEDTRIVDLTAQLASRDGRVETLEAENRGLRALIRCIREAAADHDAWDWRALATLRRTDPDYPSPPPLERKDMEGS